MNNKIYKYILFICFFVISASLEVTSIKYFMFNIDASKIKVDISGFVDLDETHNVKITYDTDRKTKCMFDDSEWIDIENCETKLVLGEHTVYIKNAYFDDEIKFTIEESIKGSFSSPIDVLDTYYLALNGTKDFDFNFDYPEDFDTTVSYIIENEDIIKIENNIITGINIGKSKVIAMLKDGNKKEYNIEVTNLIQPPTLNNNKSYLPCKRYTEEEALLLDKILDSRVKEAGYGTRGGTIASARFLTLEFPYSIRYFNENGRMAINGNGIDGEGRYYHIGLYLSESKYQYISKSTPTGPKIWGCEIYDSFVNRMNMNGFTCSGFVTWALLNGGFDVGDVGAGNYPGVPNELSDLGEHKEITYDYVRNGNYKVGDFIGRDGHAALIIGIDNTTIYTAESLPPKLENYVYERYNEIVLDSNVTYIIEMDGIYPNGDGIYKNMW